MLRRRSTFLPLRTGTEGGAADETAVASGEKHSVSIEVDAALIRLIQRKGGAAQQQIERETGVEIKFSSSKNDSQIVVEGISSESVTEASKRIGGVIEEIVKSPSLDYSHFISLPLAIHPELVEKLENFQNSILGCSTSSHDGNLDSDSSEDTLDDGLDTNDMGKISESTNIDVKLEVQDEKGHVSVRLNTADTNSSGSKLPSSSVLSELGIDRSIFIKPRTFHLTVLMLKLWNKDRVAAATEVLQKISSKVNAALDNRPVFISLKGLECMRGSAAKARVVYAPIEEIGGEGRLLQACQVIIQSYVEAGLVLEKDARQALKLHATLMNARHRKRKKRTRKVDGFDARGIFSRYGSEDWGNYLIKEAHLSKRFMFEESGYYHCCASIPFPESMQVE
ncbi:A-kinase anchor protein 7 isoforms delta and gamma [Iris pallida]|uniref:A-kinase anchor protein 7 isoforms delta and gamma n=1 Tax=Iris pallida TaxID=29817 RepID=A0AAX6DUN5_IRIPA|nr:A-kinase anchor protein 7 isoforms delta and gamma [Iris pallida]